MILWGDQVIVKDKKDKNILDRTSMYQRPNMFEAIFTFLNDFLQLCI